jgi:hypothetical protein
VETGGCDSGAIEGGLFYAAKALLKALLFKRFSTFRCEDLMLPVD